MVTHTQLHPFSVNGSMSAAIWAKWELTSHSTSEVTNQSRTSGCLVTSGCCWPSAVDEEWYSPKCVATLLWWYCVNYTHRKSHFFNRLINIDIRQHFQPEQIKRGNKCILGAMVLRWKSLFVKMKSKICWVTWMFPKHYVVLMTFLPAFLKREHPGLACQTLDQTHQPVTKPRPPAQGLDLSQCYSYLKNGNKHSVANYNQ